MGGGLFQEDESNNGRFDPLREALGGKSPLSTTVVLGEKRWVLREGRSDAELGGRAA